MKAHTNGQSMSDEYNTFYMFATHLNTAFTKRVPRNAYRNYRCEMLAEQIKLDGRKLVLNATGEGFENVLLVECIINKLNLKPDQVKIILSVDPKDRLSGYDVEVNLKAFVNWCNWYNQLQKENIDWKNITIKHKLLSLCRRPDKPRYFYMKAMLDYFKEDILVSFGHTDTIPSYIVSYMFPHSVPIVIDVPTNHVNFEPMAAIPPSTQLFESLFHVVFESNSPLDDEIFITEKTFKPFGWYQIPIFVTRKEHIDELRKMNFDLFDDILDNHRYSTGIHNPLSLIAILKKLFNEYPTLEQMQELRNKIWDRLEYNNKLLAKYVSEDTYEWTNA